MQRLTDAGTTSIPVPARTLATGYTPEYRQAVGFGEISIRNRKLTLAAFSRLKSRIDLGPRYARKGLMKTIFSAVCLAVLFAAVSPSGTNETPASDGPQFTNDGRLNFPSNYREWIFLSSGLGMTYGPAGARSSEENPMFDNVFVDRASYRSFVNTRHWPDKTIFVLEIRGSQSKGSINNGGHFQSGTMAVEVHVKDEKRFPGKWGFFGFESGTKPAKQIPFSASCYSCHSQHGAVDTTFVQFYPTLAGIAKEKGTQ